MNTQERQERDEAEKNLVREDRWIVEHLNILHEFGVGSDEASASLEARRGDERCLQLAKVLDEAFERRQEVLAIDFSD